MSVKLISGNIKRNYPVEQIGGKSQGLVKLKRLENRLSDFHDFRFKGGISVPSFFIVPTGYSIRNLDTLLRYANNLQTDHFAVRSSSPYEDGIQHSFDGVFDSYLSVDRSGLVEAIESVRASALGTKARQYSKDFNVKIDDRMAVIIQQMVDGDERGIIYSKFPASIEVSKILSWDGDDEADKETTLIRRQLRDDGTPYTIGHKVIEGEGKDEIEANGFCDVSYDIEEKFGHPVRIEYQTGWNDNGKCLYLLQARPIAGINDNRQISMPELEAGELLVGTTDINGQGDYTLPAVVIYDKEGKENLSHRAVEGLDKKFSNGYILICKFLQFWDNEYDTVTPNKKAVVAGCDLGRHHDLDIAREKGLLYLGTDNFGWELTIGNIPIKTGDKLRVVSDGVRGLLYRPK